MQEAEPFKDHISDAAMKIAIAILLDSESHNYVRKMQLWLAQRFNTTKCLKITPHITLKFPFETDTLEPFEAYLDNLAIDLEPFEIILEGIGYFDPDVIYLAIKESTSHLRDLHFRIIKDLKNRFAVEEYEFEGNNVIFHATLASHDISQENFSRAKIELTDEDPKFSFSLERLALYYYLGDDAGWTVYKEVRVD